LLCVQQGAGALISIFVWRRRTIDLQDECGREEVYICSVSLLNPTGSIHLPLYHPG